jgi:hypothetical protein
MGIRKEQIIELASKAGVRAVAVQLPDGTVYFLWRKGNLLNDVALYPGEVAAFLKTIAGEEG